MHPRWIASRFVRPVAAVTLREILVPPGIITASGTDPLGCLAPGGTGLSADHPFAAAAGRAARSGGPRWLVRLASRMDFVNLGKEHPKPGLVACFASGQGEGDSGSRAIWVAWGLPRPSVNLFLAPALVRLSTGMSGDPTREKVLELMSSKAFLEKQLETAVRVEHVLEPLTYRIYSDTPVGEIQHLMLRRGLDVVPVVGEDHELLGVITSDDVLRRILPRREGGPPSGRGSLRAGDLMTRSVLCVSEREDLAVASRSLIARAMSRLPVVTDGRLVGFLPGETVMRAFAEAFATSRSPRRVDSAPGSWFP